MTRPTDEELMGYADGVLDAASEARVAAYLATDADARDLVASFRRTAALARDAYAQPLDETPPKALVEAILKGTGKAQGAIGGATPSAGSADVVELHARRPPTRLRESLRLPIAASLALLVGMGGGYLLSRSGGPTGTGEVALGAVAPSAPLADALEHRPSGSKTGRISIVATFRDKNDRPCREIEVLSATTPPRPELAGVACRSGNGGWTVEGAVRIAIAPPAGTQFEPSGVPESDALSGLLDMLGAKPVLAPTDEKALIERRWK
jgi:hypothetical protein